ncbi:MAG: hypothetical protein WEB04_09340 [Dehalococcoidia bacterium]
MAFVLALAVLAAGCDPGRNLDYNNETNEPLFVEVNGKSGFGRLPPGSHKSFSHLADEFGGKDDPLEFHVVDLRGCTVLKLTTTLRRFDDELHDELTIHASDLPPPDERQPCDPAIEDIVRRTQD